MPPSNSLPFAASEVHGPLYTNMYLSLERQFFSSFFPLEKGQLFRQGRSTIYLLIFHYAIYKFGFDVK